MVVVISWHVKEFTPLEISAELLHQEAVARHVCIFGVPVARRLLGYQIGVAIAQDQANAEFIGKTEPVNERLVFGDVVRGGEMDLQCILELVAFREVRTTPAPKPVRILDPSKCIRQWVESGPAVGTGS